MPKYKDNGACGCGCPTPKSAYEAMSNSDKSQHDFNTAMGSGLNIPFFNPFGIFDWLAKNSLIFQSKAAKDWLEIMRGWGWNVELINNRIVLNDPDLENDPIVLDTILHANGQIGALPNEYDSCCCDTVPEFPPPDTCLKILEYQLHQNGRLHYQVLSFLT